ncbi:hypothetical protein IWW34DRAFT_778360 [Fusarium oxysporum f. sp. albedinis]|nr:hypothetical protein IWW34DRAFT_778360 [Fusarium oxysporum f. sp. albedinis]
MNDIVLCLRSGNDKIYKVRRNQVIFQIDEANAVYVQPITSSSATKVNRDNISGTEFTTTHLLGSRSALSATASICVLYLCVGAEASFNLSTLSQSQLPIQ